MNITTPGPCPFLRHHLSPSSLNWPKRQASKVDEVISSVPASYTYQASPQMSRNRAFFGSKTNFKKTKKFSKKINPFSNFSILHCQPNPTHQLVVGLSGSRPIEGLYLQKSCTNHLLTLQKSLPELSSHFPRIPLNCHLKELLT